MLAFLCSILLWHPDTASIAGWGYDLLTATFSGGLREFPRYTYEIRHLATNYSLFVNALDALWLLPMYLVEKITGGLPFSVFELWYKLGLFVAALCCGRLFAGELGQAMNERRGQRALVLFFSSGVLCVSVLGKGQVDIYSLLFLLLGYGQMQKQHYVPMALLYGASFVVKPFPVLLVAVLYLLLLGEIRWRAVCYGLLSLVPYATDALVTRLLMPDYGEYVAITSREFQETFGFSRVEQLVSVRWLHIPLFPVSLLVLYLLCAILVLRGRAGRRARLVFPVMAYILLCAFYSATFYWYVAIVPALAWMAAELARQWAGGALMLCNTLSMLGVMVLNAGGMGMVAFRPLMRGEGIPLGGWISAPSGGGLVTLFTLGFLFSMIGITGLYLWQERRRTTE